MALTVFQKFGMIGIDKEGNHLGFELGEIPE
jgi:hypothetical protein